MLPLYVKALNGFARSGVHFYVVATSTPRTMDYVSKSVLPTGYIVRCNERNSRYCTRCIFGQCSLLSFSMWFAPSFLNDTLERIHVVRGESLRITLGKSWILSVARQGPRRR